jgi:hypothetical protein
MSAFIVQKNNIDNVINFIWHVHKNTAGFCPQEDLCKAVGIEFTHNWRNDLGECLWSLNHEAVQVYRYAHRDDMGHGLQDRYKYSSEGAASGDSLNQWYTSTAVFAYQCHEDCIVNHPAIKIIDKMLETWSHLKDFYNTKWR